MSTLTIKINLIKIQTRFWMVGGKPCPWCDLLPVAMTASDNHCVSKLGEHNSFCRKDSTINADCAICGIEWLGLLQHAKNKQNKKTRSMASFIFIFNRANIFIYCHFAKCGVSGTFVNLWLKTVVDRMLDLWALVFYVLAFLGVLPCTPPL